MLARTLFAAAIVVLFAGSWIGKASLRKETAVPDPPSTEAPRRIVSMAPSVTEMLFALGLGDRVVGATRYCSYPPEVAELPRVGGHLDPNFEAIVRLRPDLVVLLSEQQDLAESLGKLGLRSATVNDDSVEQILDSIASLGERCHAKALAEELVRDLRTRMDAVRQRTADLPKPTVLVVVDRALDAGTIQDTYMAGRDDYFEHLIELAGGRNAYRGPAIPYPVVSVEGIIRISPEVIIDLAAGRIPEHTAQAIADWQRFPQIDAVAQQRIYALSGDYAMIPGPRFVLLLEALAERIHPE
ncbi:MAG: helical backbone metal receptor [Thermoguttaceae bacterium]|jgi:iron complex transport system substrate-binding protein|nr:helical backbone metal receptor [Thermoguttaceae bacterium]